MQHMWFKSVVLCGVSVISSVANANWAGRFEVLAESDNRYFENGYGIEEQLELSYRNADAELQGDLALSVSRWQYERKEVLEIFYFSKSFNGGDRVITAGRFPRIDALGVYYLDGLQFRQNVEDSKLAIYGGIRGRNEGVNSVDGEMLYGADWIFPTLKLKNFEQTGEMSWQYLKQKLTQVDDDSKRQGSQNRVSFNWRGEVRNDSWWLASANFFSSGNYAVNEKLWESMHVSAYQDVQFGTVGNVGHMGKLDERVARVRFDYEILNLTEEILTFKQQFFNNYSRGTQSHLIIGIQLDPLARFTWSLSGREVTREWGINGFGAVASLQFNGVRGWRWISQFDRVQISDEHTTSIYAEVEKALSSMMRFRFSGVASKQEDSLTGQSHLYGVDFKLEKRVRFERLPTAVRLSGEGSYLKLNRLGNEYRIALRMIYRFDGRRGEMF